MKSIAVIRFVLELAAVVALVIAGAARSWVLAVLAPLAFIIVWGAFVAPKATHRLSDRLRLGLEIALFAGVGGALAVAGKVVYGVVLFAASTIVAVALRIGPDPWTADPEHGPGAS